MSALITGAAGALSRMVARELTGEHEIIGLDLRPMVRETTVFSSYYRLKRYNHRSTDEVFRRHKPRALIHLGVRGAAASSQRQRYTQNVLGTRHLLMLAARYDVERVVVLSTFHVYGAHEHNPVNIREDAPLRASQDFPELADAVELDHTATQFLWRFRDMSTVLLRPAHIVGPSLRNRITRLLKSQYCPRLLGFDAMQQFLHEEDAARAIALALRGRSVGVYNVAGEGALPYSRAIRLAGGRPVVIPRLLLYPLFRQLSRFRVVFPHHLLDYFRYATIIDDQAFRQDFGFESRYSLVETLASLQLPAKH